MAKQRHIGFVIFGLCSVLSARIAMFEPKPQIPTAAEERWGTRQKDEGDALGLIHGLRYYVYGIGVIGLLLVVEDVISERSRKKKGSNSTLPPGGATSASSAAENPTSGPPAIPPAGGSG